MSVCFVDQNQRKMLAGLYFYFCTIVSYPISDRCGLVLPHKNNVDWLTVLFILQSSYYPTSVGLFSWTRKDVGRLVFSFLHNSRLVLLYQNNVKRLIVLLILQSSYFTTSIIFCWTRKYVSLLVFSFLHNSQLSYIRQMSP